MKECYRHLCCARRRFTYRHYNRKIDSILLYNHRNLYIGNDNFINVYNFSHRRSYLDLVKHFWETIVFPRQSIVVLQFRRSLILSFSQYTKLITIINHNVVLLPFHCLSVFEHYPYNLSSSVLRICTSSCFLFSYFGRGFPLSNLSWSWHERVAIFFKVQVISWYLVLDFLDLDII